MSLNERDRVDRDIERAALSYKRSDDGRWAAAYFAARVVGLRPYQVGATIKLSNRMGCSVDTIENLAKAYTLYAELRAVPKYRQAVRVIRKQPWIYYSYFKALHKAKEDYKLTLEQVFEVLVDMLHGEGSLHKSHLEQHVRDRFGDSRDWTYWGSRTLKELGYLLSQPDIPDDVKEMIIPAYNRLGEL